MVSSFAAEPDFAYERSLLTRLEQVLVDGVPLVDVPLFGTYSFWHRFRQSVFSSDIRRFAEHRNFSAYMLYEHQGFSFKAFIVSLSGACYSLLSLAIVFFLRPQVLLFAIDRVSDKKLKADFRTSALYHFLNARGITYVECLHTVFEKKFFLNLLARLRPVVYLEAPDVLYAFAQFFRMAPPPVRRTVSGILGCTPDEEQFITHVVQKYISDEGLVRFRVDFFKFLLHATGVRVVLAIDDARNYHDIALAGRESGVPMYAFQHGHFTKYHPGWLSNGSKRAYLHPDFLVVGSAYWKKILRTLGSVYSEDSIIVGGAMRTTKITLPEAVSSDMLLLIPYETDSPKKEVADIISRILREMPDVRIALKLRPDYSTEEQIREYGGPRASGRFFAIASVAELTERPRCCLGVYSSFLYDMVEAGIPIGLLAVSNDFGRGMVESGLADQIELGVGLETALRTLGELPRSEIVRRRELLAASGVTLEETLERIATETGVFSKTGKRIQ